MSYPNRCQHIKVNGTQCGSPALRRHQFCYFHHAWRQTRQAPQASAASQHQALTAALPLLEDANSIQGALMQV
jgi:hypothetical protein